MIELSCAAILFDMDGVLVDSQAVVKRTWRRWCERTGLDEAAVLSAAHSRRTMDTVQAVAPHLNVEAEARWLEQAGLADRDGIIAIPPGGFSPPSRRAVGRSSHRPELNTRLA